jgi:pimeloyl-ACP methyl ester carboxylesterase
MIQFTLPLPFGNLTALRLNPQGKRLCIMLHGYRDTAQTMLPIAQHFVANGYEVVLLDLPLHGTSTFTRDVYTAENLAATLLFILQHNTKPFSLLGYSLGGRLALVSLPFLAQAHHTPEQLFLLAPAGCPQNPIHHYIEMPLFLKKAVQHIANHSSIFIHLARFLHKIKLLGKFELAFTEKQLNNPEQRKLLFIWWQSLSFLLLDFDKINAVIKQNNIRNFMFFGTKDNILPAQSAAFFTKNLLHTHIAHHQATHRSILETFFAFKLPPEQV